MLKLLLSIFLILVVINLIHFKNLNNGNQNSSSKIFNTGKLLNFIKKDLENLSYNRELPNEWNLIVEVKQISSDTTISNWVPESIIHNFFAKKNGHFRLEYALIPEVPNYYNTRILIQFNLYDLKTENKIWEKIRIYEQ